MDELTDLRRCYNQERRENEMLRADLASEKRGHLFTRIFLGVVCCWELARRAIEWAA